MSNGKKADRRVFVLRDFALTELEIVLETLADPDEGSCVEVPGLKDGKTQGEIFADIVQKNIDANDAALAICDLPNANVGFEIGYALGRGKELALVVAGSAIPEWLKQPPLNGYGVKSGGDDIDVLIGMCRGDDWFGPLASARPAGDNTLVVCPATGIATTVRKQIAKHDADWRFLPDEGWELKDLPELLDGVDRVVWVITPFSRDTDQRDGVENAAGAVVAGYALATDRQLSVLRHDQAREVVDVLSRELRFSGKDDLRTQLTRISRPPIGPADTDPLTAYRRYLIDAHRQRVPFFPDAGEALHGEVYVELDFELDTPTLDSERNLESLAKFDGRGRRDLRALLGLAVEGRAARWVITGDPGAGKTTALRHLTTELAADPEGPVPVYVSLPRLAREKKHPFALAEEDTRSAMDDAVDGIHDALVERAAKRNGVWLFLDGLDELAAEHHDVVRQQLASFAKELEHVTLAVCTRKIGYKPLGEPFRQARLCALSEPAREKLLTGWLGPDVSAEVWQRVCGRGAIRELTGNPLMLTLIASLAKMGAELPTNRLTLYRNALRMLFKRGFGAEPKGVLDPHAAERLLAEFSLALQSAPGEAWPREELDEAFFALTGAHPALDKRWQGTWPSRSAFLDDVAENSGVLGPHDGAREPWRFWHRQLREHLAAQSMARLRDDEFEHRVKALDENEVPRWADTLGLVCGMAERPLERLQVLRRISTETARRVLPEVDGVPARDMLAFLAADDGWNGDDLWRLVRAWRSSGVGEYEIEELLWPLVDAKHSTEHLGAVHFALEQIGRPPARERFFETCGRPIAEVPDLGFVKVAGGTFTMGSPQDEKQRYQDEGPQHEVRVESFEVAATAVTNDAWAKFEPDFEPRSWRHGNPEELARLPVVEVSWWSAYLFTQWAGARLPSEAEWEYACRAGTTTPFWFGETITSDQVNFNGSYPYAGGKKGEYRRRTVPVGSLPPNGYGLYEMHGNVWEWCEDTWHDSYDGAPCDGSAWVDVGATLRVVRGGRWIGGARGCRSACRSWDQPCSRGDYLGFRPARS